MAEINASIDMLNCYHSITFVCANVPGQGMHIFYCTNPVSIDNINFELCFID